MPFLTFLKFQEKQNLPIFKIFNAPHMLCLKFYISKIVISCKCYCYSSTIHFCQNLQDRTIPILSTRSDQHCKQNLIISPRLLAPSCYLNWDIHSLAKQSLLFLSIVLVLCKIVTPSRSSLPFNMYYFLFILSFDLLVSKARPKYI